VLEVHRAPVDLIEDIGPVDSASIDIDRGGAVVNRGVTFIPDVRVNSIVRKLGECCSRDGHVEVNVIVIPDNYALVLRQWRIRGEGEVTVRANRIALNDDRAGQAMAG